MTMEAAPNLSLALHLSGANSDVLLPSINNLERQTFWGNAAD